MNPYNVIQRTMEVDDFTVQRASSSERILEARALRYGTPYEVTDDGGRSFYHEVWRAGVFSKTINEVSERRQIPMHWHHKTSDMPYGAVIGVVDSPEEFVFRARIVNGERGDEMIDLIEIGAVNGVSIGCHPLRDRKFSGGVERIEAALKEISLTSHAQIADGQILSMRAVIESAEVEETDDSTETNGDDEAGTPVLDEALEFINSLQRP